MTKDSTHNNMKYVRGKDTKIEIKLRKALWHEGIRYRKNDTSLPGKPDIVIKKYKIAIFCDGDFWHGYDIKSSRIHNNKSFWYEKIERNMLRDNKVTIELEEMGWRVIRIWEHDIMNQLDICVRDIKRVINDRQKKCIEV